LKNFVKPYAKFFLYVHIFVAFLVYCCVNQFCSKVIKFSVFLIG